MNGLVQVILGSVVVTLAGYLISKWLDKHINN